MKTIKIIDLLIKIANDEEVPKKISVVWTGARVHELYQYNDYLKWYETLDETTLMIINDSNDLYCEVEIIEEDKKITKIEKLNNVGNSKDIGEFKDKQQLNNHILKNKINEIIDILNEMEKGE